MCTYSTSRECIASPPFTLLSHTETKRLHIPTLNASRRSTPAPSVSTTKRSQSTPCPICCKIEPNKDSLQAPNLRRLLQQPGKSCPPPPPPVLGHPSFIPEHLFKQASTMPSNTHDRKKDTASHVARNICPHPQYDGKSNVKFCFRGPGQRYTGEKELWCSVHTRRMRKRRADARM